MNRHRHGVHYQIFMIFISALSLISVGVLILYKNLDPEVAALVRYLDHIVCAIFLFDFVWSLKKAERKLSYLKWGWLDLLASVPSVEALRFARMGKIVRILRALKSTKFLLDILLKSRRKNAALVITMSSFLIIFLGAVSILHFENSAFSNIQTPEEALWWSFVTITTVGYGDYYPITAEGRLVAGFLMVYGIGLFGSLSGIFASYVFTPSEAAETEREIQLLREEVKELKSLIKNNYDDAA